MAQLKGSSAWLGFLAGSPLVIWLMTGVLKPVVAASANPAAATMGTLPSSLAPALVAPTFPNTAGPSDYCVARFLAPIQAMAGGGSAQSVSATSPPAIPPSDWSTRPDLREAINDLKRAFGNESELAEVETMVASLPDPVDSGLSYSFETMLQALRQGVEFNAQESYYRDRSWLPWNDRDVEQARQKDSEQCRILLPGLMLFRGGDAHASKLFALLLVGESPTTGVRQAAMANALRVQQLFDESVNPSERPVRIVGPTFSAGAQSLRLALRNWANEVRPRHVAFEVVSGSATGSNVSQWLGLTPLSPNGTISYRTTTVPESTVECAYFQFLKHQLDVSPEGDRSGPRVGGEAPQALADVGTLSESGTEFGATSGADTPGAGDLPGAGRACPLKASSIFHFPFHISALRDAYEDLDHKDAQARKDATIARAVSLDASLRETRAPRDVEANPSQKTRSADDITLGNVLGYISTRHIRHLAIHATDVGDAIFLARRIRDVAPDVRLAFFDSDALLLHPDFRRELIGSLVVTPYPFLGLSEFLSPTGEALVVGGFENGNAQGVYNALLAQRGVAAAELSNYQLGSTAPLPVWISTIGRGAVVPTKVLPTADCKRVIYGSSSLTGGADRELERRCSAGAGDRRIAWKEFTKKYRADLTLAGEARLPYAWDLLFAGLCFLFAIDQARRNKTARRFLSDESPFPVGFWAASDQELDLCIARTKWRLYGAIRSFLFCLAFSYTAILYLLAVIARGGPHLYLAWDGLGSALVHDATFCGCAVIVVAAVGLSSYFTAISIARLFKDLRRFATCVGSSLLLRSFADIAESVRPGRSHGPDGPSLPSIVVEERGPISTGNRTAVSPTPTAMRTAPPFSRRMADRVTLTFGIRNPLGRLETARVSFAQLRLLAWLSMLTAAAFLLMLGLDTYASAGLSESVSPSVALVVLRNANLTSGVSPATPALLCMVSTYLWAIGRMRRLAVAQLTSRMSPPDREKDLVSTPIRYVLHPRYGLGDGPEYSDAGFTEIERNVLNAIWRPITGPYYVAAAITIAFFPVVLFTLKPLSTLTGFWGTLFLGAGLGLSVYLIGITVIQLVQYWFALKRLLKRIMEHPLGSVFRSVPVFARDSVDHQVSRSPDEALRWSACAQQFCDLTRASEGIPELEPLRKRAAFLSDKRTALSRARMRALRGGWPREGEHPEVVRTDAEVELARQVIEAAALLTELLEEPWLASARRVGIVDEGKPARVPEQFHFWLAASGDDSGPVNQLDANTERDAAGAWPAPRAVRVTASTKPPPSGVGSGPRHPDSADHGPDQVVDALTPAGSSFSSDELAWLRGAQTFVATVVTLLVHRHVRQFRYFLYVTTGCALLLVLAVSSYPFEPYRLLLTFIWVVMLSVVGACLWVFVQLDRNTLMSHISGTTPQSVTLNGAFALRVVAWTIVPLLSVAAAQYPDFANLLFAVVRPFASALR